MANDAIAADKIPITEPTPAVRKITIVAIDLGGILLIYGEFLILYTMNINRLEKDF